jgi:hypothetical protein
LASKLVYLKDVVGPTGLFGAMSETAPGLAVMTGTHWLDNGAASPASELMNYADNGSVDNMTSAAGKPIFAPNNSQSDGFMMDTPWNLSFDAGTWTVDVMISSSSSLSSPGYRVNFRVWKVNAAITSVTEITSGTQGGSVVTAGSNVGVASTATFSAPAITFNNEYLLLQLALRREGGATFRSINPWAGGSGHSFVQTPNITPGQLAFHGQKIFSIGEGFNSNGILQVIGI